VKMALMCSTHKQVQILPLGLVREGASVSIEHFQTWQSTLWTSVQSLIFPKGRRLAMYTMKTLFVLVLWEFELLPLPTNLDCFAPIDLLTHQPLINYVRLRSVSLG
jgi:hypothetical protein